MARSTKTTRSSARRDPEPAPGKRLGRPPGSKNRVKPSAPTTAASVARTTRAAPRKAAAPAAPKLSKAELEHQVVKLERTIARLRKQNAELKHAARTDAREAEDAPPAPVAEIKRVAKRAAPKTRRKAAVEERAAEAPAAPATAKRTSRRSAKSRTSPAVEPDVDQEEALGDHEDEVDPKA